MEHYFYDESLELFRINDDLILARHIQAIIKQSEEKGKVKVRVDSKGGRYHTIILNQEIYENFVKSWLGYLEMKNLRRLEAESVYKEKIVEVESIVEEKEKRPLITDMVQEMLDKVETKIMDKLDSLSNNSVRLG